MKKAILFVLATSVAMVAFGGCSRRNPGYTPTTSPATRRAAPAHTAAPSYGTDKHRAITPSYKNSASPHLYDGNLPSASPRVNTRAKTGTYQGTSPRVNTRTNSYSDGRVGTGVNPAVTTSPRTGTSTYNNGSSTYGSGTYGTRTGHNAGATTMP